MWSKSMTMARIATILLIISAVRLVADGNGEENEDLRVQPFENWEMSDDSSTYTFYLREDARGPSGEALTAADIEAVFRALVLDPNVQPTNPFWENTQVEPIDQRTVRFTFPDSRPEFNYLIGLHREQLPYLDQLILLQDSDDNSMYLNPYVGQQVQPRDRLKAWERYPSGIFQSKGEFVGTLDPELTYVVADTKVLTDSFFSDRYYLKVKPLSQNNVCSTNDCWVFQGKQGAKLPENLVFPSQ